MRIDPTQYAKESNVVLDLCTLLRSYGYKVLTEYRIGNTRIDIVIHDNVNVLCAIEVKRKKRKINPNTRQFRKYALLPLPVIWCLGRSDFNYVIETLEYIIKNNIHDGMHYYCH
jgi:hypothetical protein